MRFLVIIFFSIILIAKARAQDILAFNDKDSTFNFTVLIDTGAIAKYMASKCFVKSIRVTNRKNGELVQTIEEPSRFNLPICDFRNEKLVWIDDFNFDGHVDFALLVGIPLSSFCTGNSYYWWLFNEKTKQFERSNELEQSGNYSEFDFRNKLIYKRCRDCFSTYQFIDGIFTLVEEKKAKANLKKHQVIWTTKKLVKGRFKIVKQETEVIGDEGNFY
jgi:hypothetical protein